MQNLVKDFNDKKSCHKEPMPVYARLMDIESEVGELEIEYLKSYDNIFFDLLKDYKLSNEKKMLLYPKLGVFSGLIIFIVLLWV